MSYALQEQHTSKNQVPGPEASNTWGLGPRKVTSITIHHWGDKGQQFDIVRDFLCTNNAPTSAHYVVQDGLVACIVSPDNCAFHAGDAEGNTFSVGIECRPEATDGDYQTIGELVAFLRGLYGDIPLYPHNHWFATACPGDYDLNRIDSIARGGTISPQSIPTPAEDTVTPEQMNELKVFMQACVNDSISKMWATEGVTQQLIKDTVNSLSGHLTISPNQAEDIVQAVVNRAPNAFLNAKLPLTSGQSASVAWVLDALNNKPAATGTVTNVAQDPQAIADAIVNGVNIQIVKK